MILVFGLRRLFTLLVNGVRLLDDTFCLPYLVDDGFDGQLIPPAVNTLGSLTKGSRCASNTDILGRRHLYCLSVVFIVSLHLSYVPSELQFLDSQR